MKRILYFFALIALVSSCGTTQQLTRGSQYAKMYEEKPITLLIMPPINNSSNVDAKEYLYTSISRPLLEAGYYVIPPLLSMEILKAESAYDAELFVESPLDIFQKYFGADAIVFSEINTWTKRGFGIQTDIRYFIKSAYTGEVLFDRSCKLYLDLQVNSNSGTSSLLGQLIDLAASAINTATTDHIKAARMANYYIFQDLPRGKYSSSYLQDQDVSAEPKDIQKTVQ